MHLFSGPAQLIVPPRRLWFWSFGVQGSRFRVESTDLVAHVSSRSLGRNTTQERHMQGDCTHRRIRCSDCGDAVVQKEHPELGTAGRPSA